MLVSGKIHLTAPKFDSLQLETEALLGGRFKTSFDLASRPDHPLPRK